MLSRNGESTSFYLGADTISKMNEIIWRENFRNRSELITHLVNTYPCREEQDVSMAEIQGQIAELKELLMNVTVLAGDNETQTNIDRAISIVDNIWE